jgi:dihydrofolate reductase
MPLIYSMSVSLDGYIAGPGGDIGWSAPDDELHRFHNDRVRAQAAELLGRRLYEVMLFWETADREPDADETTRDFARLWQALPKVVFSTTLDEVEGENMRLATRDLAAEIADLKERHGDGTIGIGGAGLAASAIELGLVDEYLLFVYPVILGAGTPFFPAGAPREDLELLETRTFGSRVTYLRYGRA